MSCANITIRFEPAGIVIDGTVEESILSIARRAGIYIDAPCGSTAKCGKCKIKIISGKASDITDIELSLLTDVELEENTRLSCVAKPLGDITVYVPHDSNHMAHKKATAVMPYSIEPNSSTKQITVSVKQASITDKDLRSDYTRLLAAIYDLPEFSSLKTDKIIDIDLSVLQNLNKIIRDGNGIVNVTLYDSHIIDIKSEQNAGHYGIALDIGTTSIAAYLIDLKSGVEVYADSMPNSQAAYGGDVVSRIEFVNEKEENLEILQKNVICTINKLIESICKATAVDRKNIYEMVAVGNTCMSHIFFGINPLSLGKAPYTPTITESITVKAREIGIEINPCAIITSLPNIAGFVGADTVGVLSASQLNNKTGVWIAVDIGTNAEVLSAIDGHVLACSTAAGPAFEGAKISQGMRAQSGAIDGVTITDDIYITTIDDMSPIGLCGSGIIDAIGELVRVGIVEESGRMADIDDLPDSLSDSIKERIVKDGVILSFAKDNGGVDVKITGNDIREIQLVKGSIFAGITTMLDKLNVSTEKLDGLVIAGAFGTYITDKHAIGIGLIPEIDTAKLHFIGNAAGTGAKMALLSIEEREKIISAAKNVEYIELAGDMDFSDHFMMSMMLSVNCE